MRRLTTMFSVALVLLGAATGWAQTPESSALGGLTSRLLKAKPGAKSASSATRFSPSGQRITLDAFVSNMVKGEEDKKNLTTLLTAGFKAYEDEAAKEGVGNDVASALAFYLAAHYTAYKGTDVSDACSKAVVRQLQAALDTDEMRSAKDEDKQQLYEYFVMMGTLTTVTYGMATEQKDANLKKELKESGGAGLRSVLKIAPENVLLDDTGIHIAADGKSVPAIATEKPTVANGPSLGLNAVSYRLPAGWAEKKAEYIITLSTSSDDIYSPFSCSVIICAPRERPAKLQDAFAPAWNEIIAPGFTGEQPKIPYVCRLESGLNCTLGMSEMKSSKTGAAMAVTLYLVDSGNQVFPVVVMGSGDVKYVPVVEKLVNTMTVRGASPAKPLLQPSELAGKWTTSDRVYASYVTARGDFAGDASITTSSIMEFHTDGTYSSNFLGISGGKATKEKTAGTYRIDGDIVTMTTSSGQTTKKRFIGSCPTPDGKGRMVILLNPEYPLRPGNIGLYGEKLFLLPPK